MGLLKRTPLNNFFIRLKSWEYWPFGIIHFPMFLYWLWLSLKARSLLFFSASNPSIVLGGMLGESKYDVLKAVPDELKPKTILIEAPSTTDQVMMRLSENDLRFPLVFKPDIGERGFLVERVFSRQDVEAYLKKIKVNFLVQELVDLPVECGVFYTRFPNDPHGKVTSLVFKEMLSVTGDGASTVEELILRKERARLQWNRLKGTHNGALQNVLPAGKVLELNSIGNHCLGTKFIDGNAYINQRLSDSFDRVCKPIDGFYFGRLDLRCASLEDLYEGKVKIMEVNGCGAEPSHIYQPGFSLAKAMKVLFEHWNTLFAISVQNQKRGIPFTPLKEGVRIYRAFRSAMNMPKVD